MRLAPQPLAFAILTVSLLGAGSASADRRSARDCPAVFGGPADVAVNGIKREEQVQRIDRTPAGAVVLHNVGRWRDPLRTRLKGIVLERLEHGMQQTTALVRLEGALAELCEAATYRIQADDALGSRVRVVAVLDDGVLIELGNRLALLTTPSARPRVELVWSSNFRLVAGDAAPSKGGSRSAARTGASAAKGSRTPPLTRAATPSAGALKAAGTRPNVGELARTKARERRRGSEKRAKKK